MRIVVEDNWGVIEGASYELRQQLQERLNTITRTVGDRLKFTPTREVLDYLAFSKQFEFAPECRPAWKYLYRQKEEEADPTIEWEWKTNPFKHQQFWWSKIKDRREFGVEWEMGLGKSKVILDVVAWASKKHKIDGLLVVTLNDVHINWVRNEIPTHFPISNYMAAAWNGNRVEGGMRGIVETDKFAIATINFDSVHRKRGMGFCKRFLSQRNAVIVVDESHNIKTPSAERTKALIKLGKMAERRYILTGTPVTQGPLDLWSQYTFLNPAILGNMTFGQFKQRYAVMQELSSITYKAWVKDPATGKAVQVDKPVEVVVGYQNLEELKQKLDPFRTRLLKDDVLDLPEKIYRLRSFTMSDEMRKAYMSMKDNLLVLLETGERMTAQIALAKLIRLQQIVCGYVVPDDMTLSEDILGSPLAKTNPRLEALMTVLEEVQYKAIIWANFRYSQREIAARIAKDYGEDSFVMLTGETPKSQRMDNVQAFQTDDKIRWAIASQQAAGTGITLTAARDVIYYSNSYNLALRLQSEDRAHRIGQKFPVTYTDLEALGTIDREILKALLTKFDIASQLTGDDLRSWLSVK